MPFVLATLLAGCGGADNKKSADRDEAPAKGLPKVSGDYGTKPKIRVDREVKPAAKTTSTVLVQGKGPKIATGDLLIADYLGQIYATNKVFDNSYDRGQPIAIRIGPGGSAIIGWTKALVGVSAGSRVVMVVPPRDGYGQQGNEQAGIKGTDTLVFVVDVIASYGKSFPKTTSTPVTDVPPGLPKVTGVPMQRPTLTVPKGTVPPKEPKATVLARGSGAPLEASKVAVMHFEAVSWAGQQVASSWQAGSPQAVPLGSQGQPNPFDILTGIPVGSRVLVVLPPQPGGKATTDSLAVVADVIAQHGPAKEEA